jgi:branched-chain amino acid transport system permease protein
VSGTEIFIQQVLNGLTIGSYLALIALGYTMVYGIIELINFAHGDLFMLGFMISLTLFQLFETNKAVTGVELVGELLLVFAVTMLTTGLINVSIDRVAYKPLRRAPRLAPLITAVGASFALENLAGVWKGANQISYPNILPTIDLAPYLFGQNTTILFNSKDVFLLVITIPLMIGLNLFVQRTKVGKAMRATAQDREAAALMGINAERVIMSTFFLGGALAGAAGTVFGLYLNTGHYLMGFEAGLQAFTAAVLGGIGNLTGAVLGAYMIAFLRVFSDQYLTSSWTRALIFAMLILVLVFKPSGLLGENAPEKA